MQVGRVKIRHFRRKTRYNSKMVQDRGIVSIEVVCALSNGYVADDLGWPITPQTTPIFAFFVAFHIFVMIKHRDFIFGVQVDVASPSQRTTNRPWKERGYVTWHVLNFPYPIHISGMAEARALKLCTKGDYIKSGLRDDNSPLKGMWFCSRDPFFVCTAVELERNLHSTRWFAINRVFDDGYWVSHVRRSTVVQRLN